MTVVCYRYLAFFLTTFLIFHDGCSRYIAPLSMIGGMVKKNCSDPRDTGEFCWSDQLQASFIGAFFYGYALQMLSTYVAARVGFNACLRCAAFLSGFVQLTVPVTVGFSPGLAVVLQGIRGNLAGLFMTNIFECGRKWGLKEEGKLVISLAGMMLLSGSGVGPFLAGLLTEHLGWSTAYYISGGVFLFLFGLLCVFLPDNPLDARFMSEEEKSKFRAKQETEAARAAGDDKAKQQVSLSSIIRRGYVYCFCFYQISYLFVYYPELTVLPFYFYEFHDADTEFLAYLQLTLSMIAAVSIIGWKSALPLLDRKIPWFKCRVGMMIIPLAIRSLDIGILPFTNSIVASIALLVVNNILVGSTFAGGIMTLNFELDPLNGPVIAGIYNGIGQATGFINPLVRAAITTVDKSRSGYWDAYEERWRYFFVVTAGVGMVGVVSVIVGVVARRSEWRRHPTLEVHTVQVELEPVELEPAPRRRMEPGGEPKECTEGTTIENLVAT